MTDFNQIRYQNDYNQQKYDRTTIMTPKGEKDLLRSIAKESGMSLNEYIVTAIHEKLDRDGIER